MLKWILGLVVLASGCSMQESFDMGANKVVIVAAKSQDIEQMKRKAATFVLTSYATNAAGGTGFATTRRFILPFDFGETGNYVQFTNGIMYTRPQ